MQYFGGKYRIADSIVSVLNKYRKENQIFVELFVGGANIMCKMAGERYAYDFHRELICLWKSLQKGYIPPVDIDRELYINIKQNPDKYEPELVAFVGFGCSFAGKYFGGYASSLGRNYASNAKNSLLSKIKTLKDVKFECKDYREVDCEGALIYLDPPYLNTTQPLEKFDTKEFWERVRYLSKKNTVIVSEYQAPEDFECIWEKNVNLDIRNKHNQKENRVEKLFKLKQ